MTKKEIELVLNEIFDPYILGDENKLPPLSKAPTFKEIKELIELMIADRNEESFQSFLSRHSHFLFRLAPWTEESVLGMLTKLPISNFNFSDFAIFTVSQGGCRLTLIEIERPNDKLFTQKLTPAKKLQTAIGQIHDWDEWLKGNFTSFLNTAFRKLEECKPYSENKRITGSFINASMKELKNVWQGFGGNESCRIDYLIIIGRWSKLTDREKKRLLYLNQTKDGLNLRIRTYDNFIRKAIEGPNIFW